MKNLQSICVTALCTCALTAASAVPAGAQSTPAAAQGVSTQAATGTAAAGVLRQRTAAYYNAIKNGDRATARKYVNPASNDEFEKVDLKSIMRADIKDVAVAATGDSAVVSVIRVYGPPFEIGMPWKDSWTLVNGEWLLTVPPPEGDNPFGIKPSKATVDEKEMEKQIERQGTVLNDPDQLYKAIAAVDKQEREKQKQTVAAKAAETQGQATPANSTQKSKKKSRKDTKQASEAGPTGTPDAPKQP